LPADERDRHRHHERRGVRIGRLTGVQRAEVLSDHPDREREQESGGGSGAGGPAVENGEPDRRLGCGEQHNGQRPVVTDPAGERALEAGEPAGRTVGGHGAGDVGSRVVHRQNLQHGGADPQRCPCEWQPARGWDVGAPAARPGSEREHAVDENRARGAAEQTRVPARESGQALAEEPHPERPGERSGEREPGGAGREQPEPDQQLNRREGHVPGDRVGRDQVRRPVDRAGDEVGLPGSQRGDHLPRKAGAEHERLELQCAVQEPEEPQDDLQGAPRDSYVGDGEREPAERKIGAAEYLRAGERSGRAFPRSLHHDLLPDARSCAYSNERTDRGASPRSVRV
jgi:hypothetical protein